MEQQVERIPRFTVEEYFSLAAEAKERHEYRDGEIIAMAGGTESHSLIAVNICGELRNRLKGKPCRVYNSDLRFRPDKSFRYTNPDAMVVCRPAEFDKADISGMTIVNPKVVMEVLSPSTERADRGEKFDSYIQSPSLEEYVLVNQDKPRVQTFLRQADGTWSFAYFDGLDAIARFRSISIELPMREIYFDVTFPPAPLE